MSTNTQKPELVPLVGTAIAQPWVPAETRAAIHRAADDALELADQIKAVQVVDNAAAAKITELLTLAATKQREVEQHRRSITDPLKKRAKEIEDAVRPLVEALGALITAGKSKVISWQRAERERVEAERRERERQEAEAISQARAQAAETGGPVAVANVPPPVAEAPRGVKTDYGSAQVKALWRFEVEDASKVPPEFMEPNLKAIGAAVRAGVRSIPGVRIYEDATVAVTAAR